MRLNRIRELAGLAITESKYSPKGPLLSEDLMKKVCDVLAGEAGDLAYKKDGEVDHDNTMEYLPYILEAFNTQVTEYIKNMDDDEDDDEDSV